MGSSLSTNILLVSVTEFIIIFQKEENKGQEKKNKAEGHLARCVIN